MMVRALLGLAVLVLAACGESGTGPEYCTREAVDEQCTEPSTAEYVEEEGYWLVTLRQTVRYSTEYVDQGVQCVLSERVCQETTCIIYGDFDSESDAISACAG